MTNKKSILHKDGDSLQNTHDISSSPPQYKAHTTPNNPTTPYSSHNTIIPKTPVLYLSH